MILYCPTFLGGLQKLKTGYSVVNGSTPFEEHSMTQVGIAHSYVAPEPSAHKLRRRFVDVIHTRFEGKTECSFANSEGA